MWPAARPFLSASWTCSTVPAFSRCHFQQPGSIPIPSWWPPRDGDDRTRRRATRLAPSRLQQPQSDLAQRLAVLVFVALRGYAKPVSDDQVGFGPQRHHRLVAAATPIRPGGPPAGSIGGQLVALDDRGILIGWWLSAAPVPAARRALRCAAPPCRYLLQPLQSATAGNDDAELLLPRRRSASNAGSWNNSRNSRSAVGFGGSRAWKILMESPGTGFA